MTDVKPQNTWYDGNEKPRLSDSGLALKEQAFGQAVQRRMNCESDASQYGGCGDAAGDYHDLGC